MTASLPSYVDQFPGNDNYGKPRAEYVAKINQMTDDALLDETENVIWLSAYASNNSRSDYHWQVSACYAEWDHRGKPNQYTVAYNRAKGY